MKKLYFLFFALIFSSCEKEFIELAPEGQQSSETFFQTEEHFQQAVVAAYQPLRDLLVNEFFTAEMRSDNTHYQYSQTRGTAYEMRENIPDFINNPRNNYVNAVYFHSYKGISRTNMVLERIQNANLDEEVRAEIEGQANFLRAYYYFKLVRYFGGVPLHLSEVNTSEEAFLPRSSVDEVYDVIIADATNAISQLDVPENFPQSGAVTKGAATMLLAEVYMTLHRYEEAESLLKSILGMGYELLPEYSQVFSTANKNSSESIFEVQYLAGLQGGQHSNFIYSFIPRTRNTEIITGVMTGNVSAGGFNTPTQDLINSYEPGDERLEASIAIAEGTYDNSGYFTVTANKSILNYTPAEGNVGIPYIKKYLNPHSDPNNTDDNWPIYRYAGALLMLAEALNEQGKGGEALPYLNQVRKRAGLDPINTTGQSELREAIAQERRVELAFENHRWHDLVRTGKAIEVMTPYGKVMKERYEYLAPSSYQITPEKLIYPIPFSEIELNPELEQNPGYAAG